MEHNEGDELDSAVTQNCHLITQPLDPIYYTENCPSIQQFLPYSEYKNIFSKYYILLNVANQIILFKCAKICDTIPEIPMKEKVNKRSGKH